MSRYQPRFINHAPIASFALLVTSIVTGCASHPADNSANSAPMTGATVRARHGMVVSVSAPASQAGVRILQRGGNAVDAAVATAFALAVTFPEAGNIGGGGFMLIQPAAGNVNAPVM